MNIQPLSNKVFLELVEEKERESGIIMMNPDNVNFVKATVVAIGPGRVVGKGYIKPVDVKVGDVVMVNKYIKEVEIKNYKYSVCDEDDIICILNQDI